MPTEESMQKQGGVRRTGWLDAAACFVVEFDKEDFPLPNPTSRWFTRDDHDPPWTMRELRMMAKHGIIEMQEGKEFQGGLRYRLTLKASELKGV